MSNAAPFDVFAGYARARRPDAALVLGSGLSRLAGRCRAVCRVPFAEVPGLATPSVASHEGCLTLGDWAGKRVVLFEGRLHHYEGHPWHTVVQPVVIARALGARVLLLTNAAGGVHDALGPGSLLAVRDHIEWTWPYCWRRPGPGGLGSARASPYALALLERLSQAARDQAAALHAGVYAAVTGPCYETPAEIRAMKACGADAVGMSTTREVEKGHELGLECAAVSLITNRAAGLSTGPIHHEEVLATALATGERLAVLLEGFLQRL